MSLPIVGDFGWLYFGAYINYVLVGVLVYYFGMLLQVKIP